jgi:hypothetical protein
MLSNAGEAMKAPKSTNRQLQIVRFIRGAVVILIEVRVLIAELMFTASTLYDEPHGQVGLLCLNCTREQRTHVRALATMELRASTQPALEGIKAVKNPAATAQLQIIKLDYNLRSKGLALAALTILIGAVMVFAGFQGSLNWVVEAPQTMIAKLTNASPGIVFVTIGMILGFVVFLKPVRFQVGDDRTLGIYDPTPLGGQKRPGR